MEEFIHRTISDSIKLDRVKAGPLEVVASRTRTSKGYSSISLRIDNHVVLMFDSDVHGSNYEQAVRGVADLLMRITEAT